MIAVYTGMLDIFLKSESRVDVWCIFLFASRFKAVVNSCE